MAKLSLEEFTEVPRSPRECYLYARNFANAAEWEPGSIASRKLTPGPVVVGSEFEVTVKFAGRKQDMHYVIDAMTEDQQVVLTGTGKGFKATDTISFSPLPNGGTRIGYRADFSFKKASPAAIKALSPLLKHMGKKAVRGLGYALTPRKNAPVAGWWQKLGDRAVVPGMINFTKRGYQQLLEGGEAALPERMDGKLVVVTGATDGLGKATAKRLAEMGAQVVLVSRTQEKLERVQETLIAETGNRDIFIECADLTLLAETRALAERLQKRFENIDVLVNNAGALYNRREITSEGNEKSLAILLLSPFLLTELLLPRLRATAAKNGQARIVNVSSGGMYTQPMFLNDLQYEKGDYDGPKAYARAKRGLVAVTERWAKDEAANNIVVNAMHPGWAATPGVSNSLPAFEKKMRERLRTPEQGADTIIWLAAAVDAGKASGKFWMDRRPRPTAVFPKTALGDERASTLYDRLKGMVL